GFYAEKLDNATFDAVHVIDSGNVVAHNATFPNASDTQAGFDINLKYGDFSGITITNSEFIDSGRYLEPHAGHDLAGARLIKARDDGSYASSPATLTGVSITGNTFTNTNTPANQTETEVGIRIGETGATPSITPSVTDVEIAGNTFNDIDVPVTNTTSLVL